MRDPDDRDAVAQDTGLELEQAVRRLAAVDRERADLLRRIDLLSGGLGRLAAVAGAGTRRALEPATAGTGLGPAEADAVIEGLPGVFYVFCTDGTMLRWNRNLEEETGFGPEELARMHPLELLAPRDRPAAAARLRDVEAHGSSHVEAHLLTKDGAEKPLLFAGARVTIAGDSCVMGVGLDISARKAEEDRLREMSVTDELTGLLNRRGFFAAGRDRLEAAGARGEAAVLLYADLDALKTINDTGGHSSGDRAIRRVADALRETFRESDVVARIGGDEFAALATDPDGVLRADKVAERFAQNVREPDAGSPPALSLSASVGLAACRPCHGVTIDDLLVEADARMYEQKAERPGAERRARGSAARATPPRGLTPGAEDGSGAAGAARNRRPT